MSSNRPHTHRTWGLFAGLLLAACTDVPLVSDVPGLSDMLLPAEADEAAGNVVIQYSNGTAHAVQWKLTWRLAGSSEPSEASVLTEPGQAGTLAVTGEVELVTVTAERAVTGAARDESAQPWTAGPLLIGQNFHPGDIISFTLVAPPDAEASLGVEVLPGG